MIVIVLAPILCAGLIALIGNKPNLREAITLVTGLLTFTLIIGLYPIVADGETPLISLLEMLPGLSVTFKLEPLGFIFSFIASFLWIVTSIYSIGYMRGHGEKNQTRFYLFFAVAISAVFGISFSGNLLTLFIFYEILTISTFPLVTHHGH